MINGNAQDVIPSKRLDFELVDTTNILTIPLIFKSDENPFIIQAYKDVKKIKAYYKKLQLHRIENPTLSNGDWLIKFREENTYIGVISLYDLSTKVLDDQHLKCSLGFAIRSDYHRQYFATEAVAHFLAFIKNHLKIKFVLAYTQDGNLATKSLLKKIGFEDVSHAYISGPDIRVYQIGV